LLRRSIADDSMEKIFFLISTLLIPFVVPSFSFCTASGPHSTLPKKVNASSPIEWKRPSDARERRALESWGKGVGPAVISGTPKRVQDVTQLDSLVIVSWNTHVGGADLNTFIQDLRSGKLTDGEPIHDFVLLLQEAFRAGPSVPDNISPDVPTGTYIRTTPPSGERIDIVKTARQHGLSLFYVPLMRNGRPEETDIPEDRGNAILSTIRLSSFTAVELPYERQRRLAIGAKFSGETINSSPWTIQVISVHLENRARWFKVLRSFRVARLRQVEALVNAFLTTTPTVFGGDFNTWFKEWNEPAIAFVEKFFDGPARSQHLGTVKYGYFLPERVVDYLFFRLPEGWSATYQRIDNRYGSDHYPLLGRVRISPLP